jgi:phosphoribosyl-ATP pyrophosphohydrolase/phosphoribosyl-AMP cyclohydrolase
MVKFDDRGLIPAVVQDASSGTVLTVAFMNEEALLRTLEGPDVWFYSRSRGGMWHKGETSGNYLKVREVLADCDGDAVLVKADPTGPACHTGQTSCFHNPIVGTGGIASSERATGPGILAELAEIIERRKSDPPPGSYTARLFGEGTPRIAQKVVEEAGETAIAAVTEPKERLAAEMADVLYHALVLLSASGVPLDEVWKELARRRK